METITAWLRCNFWTEKIDVLWRKVETGGNFSASGVKHIDTARLTIYGVLILTVALFFIGRKIQKDMSKTTLSLRSRSPDPGKSTDVKTYVAQRMKPTERPPGSESAIWP